MYHILIHMKKTSLFIGLMSGTSMDGIDAVLVEITEEDSAIKAVKLLDLASVEYTPELKTLLLELCSARTTDIDALTRAHFGLGEWNARAVLRLLSKTKVDPKEIAAIGMHGQTIWHAPTKLPFPGITHPFEIGGTLQIGNPQVVSLRTGIPVISDFRAADVALGGEGAPLALIIDHLFFSEAGKTVAVQNIGGIGNVTVLPKAGELYAFDTGPGNMIIDALVQRHTGQPYDDGGSLASRGKIDEALLHRLMDDPYFALSPPKSTGREVYGAPYVQRLIEMAEHLPFEDLIATATAFTAYSIADSYKRFVMPRHGLDRVVVSGGGARNKTLLSYLGSYLDREIVTGEAYGVPDQGREAMAFALLAHESLNKRPSNFPLATGARERTILGTITLQEPVQI